MRVCQSLWKKRTRSAHVSAGGLLWTIKGPGRAPTGVTVTDDTRAERTTFERSTDETSERFSSSTRERMAIETADGEQVLRGARPSFKGFAVPPDGSEPTSGYFLGGFFADGWRACSPIGPKLHRFSIPAITTFYRQRVPVLRTALGNAGKRIGEAVECCL
jgi:hypothetical protein